MSMTARGLWFRSAVLPLLILVSAAGQLTADDIAKTKIILLGTGAPAPNPERSGPATAIVVNETGYLIDLGPGVVRRANAAFLRGVQPLEPTRIRIVFVTHLHSDHTVGYPDLIFTAWTVGRRAPLEVYGPKGPQGDDRSSPGSVSDGHRDAHKRRWQSA
jgi:ribonuclease BN (tRNA processing enzyme)